MSEVTTASTKKSGVFEDILEVLWAPAAVFDRARSNGIGKYILVLTIILVALLLATKGLMQPYIDANFDLSMQQAAAKGKAPPPEAMATARNFASYGFLGFTALYVPFTAVLFGLVLFLAGKFLSAPMQFGQAALVATLSTVPRVLSFLAMAIQGAITDTSNVKSIFDASIGPARFMDATTTSPVILGLVAQLDLFNIWQFVICAVGISVIARVERSTGYVAAIVAFAITAALSILPQALA
ncbi:MAG: YIP1 family protein [Gemmatimonadaceae bacterium]|nr:YIP1 family protein [Gemmatimonadaceae bacterium]